MKIITLNIWAGIVGPQLIEFFKEKQDIDIFCLQEVMHEATEWTNWDDRQKRNILTDISAILPHHAVYYRPAERGEWGLAIFVKNTISIVDEGEIFVHLKKDGMEEKNPLTVGKNLQWMHIGNKNVTICNFHGLWNGNGKTDTPDRIQQSKNIVNFLQTVTGKIILLGDFNLLPHTESLSMIEDFGLRNLVKEYGINSTRTSYYTKPDKYADYILVSDGIEVKDFKVLPDEVSDHSPLLIEI